MNDSIIMTRENEFDVIGPWSEIKHEIIEKYATAYSKILANQRGFQHFYIDAFSGAGVCAIKNTGELVKGSPLRALDIEPPFSHYFFIDLKSEKIEHLQKIVENHSQKPNTTILNGDSNKILIKDVFPLVKYNEYKRALCLLDPYGLHFSWEVLKNAAELATIEIFLNFPLMDINRNVLWTNPANVKENQKKRMNLFWGDNSWQEVCYGSDLFGISEKILGNETVVKEYRKRLRNIFKDVPEPLPIRNTQGNAIYYLFFASNKAVARNIVGDIFKKYR